PSAWWSSTRARTWGNERAHETKGSSRPRRRVQRADMARRSGVRTRGKSEAATTDAATTIDDDDQRSRHEARYAFLTGHDPGGRCRRGGGERGGERRHQGDGPRRWGQDDHRRAWLGDAELHGLSSRAAVARHGRRGRRQDR